jgi:protoheme IX farnesyltransferase
MNLSKEAIKTGIAALSRAPIVPKRANNGNGALRPVAMLRPVDRPSRTKDYVVLTKPEVLFLVLIAAGLGCVMASDTLNLLTLFHSVVGTALVAGGTAALNQYMERSHDAQMRRTARRPLPAGRLRPKDALLFGVGLSLVGTVYLALTLNLLTSLIGLAALLGYLLLYTPLKRRSRLCTFIGAFPGAAPVLMGWAAARGGLSSGAWVLYAILFLWQFPHFLAIGWMYREDYGRAGMQMIPGGDDSGKVTFELIRLTALVLVVVSFFPTMMGMAGKVYLCFALLLGLGLLFVVNQAAAERSGAAAKRLLHATVIYLPLLYLFLVAYRTDPVNGWPI